MKITANVAAAYPNKYYIKVENGELKGRGIKEQTTSIPNTKKYLVTEKAFEAIKNQYSTSFVNVIC